MRPPSLKSLVLTLALISMVHFTKWIGVGFSENDSLYDDIEIGIRDVKNRSNQPKKILVSRFKLSHSKYGNDIFLWKQIMSSWGSGSGTLSSILLKHLNVYFHQEPLHYFGSRQVETVLDTIEAKRVIEALLKCEYRNPVLGNRFLK